ncbi:dynein heavy chain, partial [Coemansia sp. RSA 2703]
MGDSDVQASVEVERTATLCDPNVVKQYLLNLVPVLLCGSDPQIDGAEDELEAVKAMFAFPDTSDKCRVFANDPNAPVMYVLKEIEPVDEHTGFSTASFALSFELSWKPTHAGSIALIKRVQTLDPAVSIARQIQVMNLPGPASSSGAAASVAATAADTGALPPSSESA